MKVDLFYVGTTREDALTRPGFTGWGEADSYRKNDAPEGSEIFERTATIDTEPADENSSQMVLITGSPAGGFELIGPVTANDPDLEYYTDVDPRPPYWWYAPLHPLPRTGTAR